MVDSHTHIKKIRLVNKYTIALLIVVISLFSISLLMLAFGDITDEWIIHVLSVGTIATFAAVIPLCYLLMIKDIDLKAHDEEYIKTAFKLLEWRIGILTRIQDQKERKRNFLEALHAIEKLGTRFDNLHSRQKLRQLPRQPEQSKQSQDIKKDGAPIK